MLLYFLLFPSHDLGGYVPNFQADFGDFVGGGLSFALIAPAIQSIVQSSKEFRQERKEDADAMKKVREAFEEAAKGVTEHGNQLEKLKTEEVGANNRVKELRAQVATAEAESKTESIFTRRGKNKEGEADFSSTQIKDFVKKVQAGDSTIEGIETGIDKKKLRELGLGAKGGVKNLDTDKLKEELIAVEQQRLQAKKDSLANLQKELAEEEKNLQTVQEKTVTTKEELEARKKVQQTAEKEKDEEEQRQKRFTRQPTKRTSRGRKKLTDRTRKNSHNEGRT